MDRDTKPKINTKDEKIWVTDPQQRYGKQELISMYVPNPNWKGRKRKRREC